MCKDAKEDFGPFGLGDMVCVKFSAYACSGKRGEITVLSQARRYRSPDNYSYAGYMIKFEDGTKGFLFENELSLKKKAE